MKVAMIIEAWHPIWGGGQSHVFELSKKLISNHVNLQAEEMVCRLHRTDVEATGSLNQGGCLLQLKYF